VLYFPPHLQCVATLPCEKHITKNINILTYLTRYHHIVDKINHINWYIGLNVYVYELPTKFAKFHAKDLTGVKMFQKVLGGYIFETPYRYTTQSVSKTMIR